MSYSSVLPMAISQFTRDIGAYSRKTLLRSYKLPYMRAKEIDLIREILVNLKPLRCLEWGCGYSTVYFPKYLSKDSTWLSIEHNEEWQKSINGRLCNKNVRVVYVEPNNPAFKNDGSYDDFKSYVDYPIKLGEFDLILIDGRARKDCLKNALNLISQNGVVIVHDANRSHYFVDPPNFPYSLLLNDARKGQGGIWIGSRRPIGEILRTGLHSKAWEMSAAAGKVFGMRL